MSAVRIAPLFAITILLGLISCAGPKPVIVPPTIVQAALEAQPTVNPDARGRPSPVVVRFYTLKSRAAFDSADFFSLFEKDKETLGAELVEREEFQLMPGEKREFKKQFQPDEHYVGVVAAFRDLEHSRWRAAVAIPPQQVTALQIRLEGNNLTITAGK